MTKTKPFKTPKRLVYQAYKEVKANQGSAGIDEVSIEDFEKDLKNNLYKVWNRMSSGTYFFTTCKSGRNTEEKRRYQGSGNTNCCRQNSSNGCEIALGTQS